MDVIEDGDIMIDGDIMEFGVDVINLNVLSF